MRMQKMQKTQCMGKNHTHFWARTTLMPRGNTRCDAAGEDLEVGGDVVARRVPEIAAAAQGDEPHRTPAGATLHD